MLPELIYSFFIGPVELLLEFIFSTFYKISGNIGVSIILMGLFLNICILPIYNRADKVSEEKLDKEKKLNPWITKIKKAFKGDERFMMLQALYRENDYSPVSSLLASFSLLLEIPFFIAAFHMLSHLHIMEGVSFLGIKDLSLPDGMIPVGDIRINLLPILMTVINIISGFIYTKGRSSRERIQIYGLALIFLVLLYTSPSGLVLYWTVNNIFSLFKNIISPFFKGREKKEEKISYSTGSFAVFAGLLFAAVFVGLYIPSSIIKSSVSQFIDPAFTDPVTYLFYSFVTSLGAFVFWISVIRFIATDKWKGIIGTAVTGSVFVLTLNFFLFFDVSRYTNRLMPEAGFTSPDMMDSMINIILNIMIMMLVFILVKNKKRFQDLGVYMLLLAVITLSVMNIISIEREYEGNRYIMDQKKEAEFKLTSDGRNVVVVMLDRAAGYLVPYIFNEKPELMESFDGFTFYPNTLSTGAYTNSGAPGLYGGYDYTSDAVSGREGDVTAHAINSALRVMPLNFLNAGYNVTVSDPSYANMKWIPDLSIYDDHPEISAFVTEGRYMEEDAGISEVWKRDLFCYGLFRTSPLILRGFLFDSGIYNEANREYAVRYTQTVTGDHSAIGYDEDFMDSYSVLMDLPEITNITEGEGDCFLMFVNYTAHDFGLLQEPEYCPQLEVDNTEYESLTSGIRTDWDGNVFEIDGYNNEKFYDSNMAAYIGLGQWFDYLREQGVYDNTRIIIVADHAYSYSERYRFFNPVLMVKDFDSSGFTVDEGFMTNADTPLIAMEGIVDDPVDPETNAPITDEDKYEFPYYVIYNYGDMVWYRFEGDVREESSFTLDQ